MSTIASTNLKHPSSATNNITLASTGAVAVNGAMTGAGLDLITPTSIAYSGGSASVSGGAVSFSNATSVSLNGVFSSTYDNYKIVINITNTNQAGESFLMRLRTSGTDSAISYLNSRIYTSGASVGTDQPSTVGIWAGYAYSAAPTASISITEIQRPNVAEWTKYYSWSFWSNGSGSAYTVTDAGVHQVSTAYDSLTVYPYFGTLSGIIRVYGYKNS